MGTPYVTDRLIGNVIPLMFPAIEMVPIPQDGGCVLEEVNGANEPRTLQITHWDLTGVPEPTIEEIIDWSYTQEAEKAQLSEAQEAAYVEIDTQAEEQRQKVATPGDLMSAIYRQKQAEARDYNLVVDGGGTPNAGDYPLMVSRAARLGVALADVAAEWTAKTAAWVQVAASIEATREQVKEDVRAATALEKISAILDQLTWL